MKKTRAQLEVELEAANKRCADLADALVKQVMSQPVYVPYFVTQPAPLPLSPSPFYVGPMQPIVTWNAPNTNVCAGGIGPLTVVEMKS